MRGASLVLLLALGCGSKSSSTASAPASARFLPASPDLVVRADMAALRAWPKYDKVAPAALASFTSFLSAVKTHCDLDVAATAREVLLARQPAASGGDMTLILRGLDPARVKSCIDAAAKANAITQDAPVFHVGTGGASLASGALLPDGDVVLVMRGAKGVEPAAWKTEVAGIGAAPAYLAELTPEPVAFRMADDKRTITAGVVLADPLIVRGKIVGKDQATGDAQAKLLKAIASYIEQAKAGTPRIEPQGKTVFADLTAKGEQIDTLVALAVPALFGTAPRDVVADATAGPGDCTQLPAAVDTYIAESLDKTPADRRAEMQRQVDAFLPKLRDAYRGTCEADAWSAPVVECHIANATALARFERCRMLLPEPQRVRLDAAITTALQASGAP